MWRRAAIADAGGWNCRTTVEDMDLSLRAFLKARAHVHAVQSTRPGLPLPWVLSYPRRVNLHAIVLDSYDFFLVIVPLCYV